MFPPSTWAYHIEMNSFLISVDKANILLVSDLRVFQLTLLLLSSCLRPSLSHRPRTIPRTQDNPADPGLSRRPSTIPRTQNYPTDPGLSYRPRTIPRTQEWSVPGLSSQLPSSCYCCTSDILLSHMKIFWSATSIHLPLSLPSPTMIY